MVFLAKLADGDVFKKVVEAIKELCVDCNFECGPGGIECQSMDNSHVALVSLSLSSDGFSEYECDENITLGLNLGNLSKILKCSGAKESLIISAEDTENVKLEFENQAEDRKSTFELKMFDIDAEHLGIPDTEYKCDVTLPSTEFARICRDLGTLGDAVTLNATKSGLQFTTNGDIGNANMILRKNETAEGPGSVDIELDEPVSQQFALRYLQMFSKSANVADRVTLSMSPETPLQVNFPIADMGSIKFFLAPKIEEDN